MHDYPSFKWLGITELHYQEKFINKVAFKQCLAQIPRCREDTSGAAFEDWIYKFSESKRSELYISFPYQIEAFPHTFEDPFSVYKLNCDPVTGILKVQKFRQDKTPEEWNGRCRLIAHKLSEQGIYVGIPGEDFNTLVTLNPVIGTEYDELQNDVFKVYSDQSVTLPVNVVMKKRHANHY